VSRYPRTARPDAVKEAAASVVPPSGPPLFIAGPTAVGKSAAALALARQLGGEIIAVDSMQVYRGLDIGTAKASAAERQQVRHHLVDVVDLTGTFDAAQFVLRARRAVADIEARRGVPVFCGGTGLYFKAYLEGLGATPPPEPSLRAELESTPLSELLAELERVDPATGARIDPANRRRVVRAVEVVRLSGQPASVLRSAWSHPAAPGVTPAPAPLFGLTRSAEDLRARINRRVDAMFEGGLVDETEGLLAQGLERNRTAMQAIGYRQVVEHLRGVRSLEATVLLVKQKTWQFARRQMTWFRRQLPVRWLELSAETEPAVLATQLAERWRNATL